MTPCVHSEVAIDLALAICLGRDHGGGASSIQFSPQPIGIEGFVPGQGLEIDILDQGLDADTIVALARQKNEARKVAKRIHKLLVSHWYVDSAATVELIIGAFGQMQANPQIGRAEAMRRAMAALIARGGASAHPRLGAVRCRRGGRGAEIITSAVAKQERTGFARAGKGGCGSRAEIS